MVGIQQQVSVRTELGANIAITLPLHEQQNIVHGAMDSLTRMLPDLDERAILNTPWPDFRDLRRHAIQRDLTAYALERAELLPDA